MQIEHLPLPEFLRGKVPDHEDKPLRLLDQWTCPSGEERRPHTWYLQT